MGIDGMGMDGIEGRKRPLKIYGACQGLELCLRVIRE